MPTGLKLIFLCSDLAGEEPRTCSYELMELTLWRDIAANSSKFLPNSRAQWKKLWVLLPRSGSIGIEAAMEPLKHVEERRATIYIDGLEEQSLVTSFFHVKTTIGLNL